MKARVESTKEIITMDGVPVRVWKGVTENGTRFELYVPRVGHPPGTEAEFQAEFEERRTPKFETIDLPPARS